MSIPSLALALLAPVACNCARLPEARVEPQAPAAAAAVAAQAATTQTFDHAAFSSLLQRHVRGDAVDYAALKKERAILTEYLQELQSISGERLKALSREEQMAFWINAYNAWTLESILERYPLKSIRDIDQVWDRKHPVAGRSLSLNAMEHEILRKEFRDARIHFAVNCASVGCPPLRAEAFVGRRLDAQLTEQARKFLADGKRNHIQQGQVQLSQIFEWFGEDFGGPQAFVGSGAHPTAVLKYLAKQLPDAQRVLVSRTTPTQVSYLEYDWTLNDIPRP